MTDTAAEDSSLRAYGLGERVVLFGEGDESHKVLYLVVGEVEYRAVAFDDGSLRIWSIGQMRAVGPSSIIIEPFRSKAARELSAEDALPCPDDDCSYAWDHEGGHSYAITAIVYDPATPRRVGKGANA